MQIQYKFDNQLKLNQGNITRYQKRFEKSKLVFCQLFITPVYVGLKV